MAARKEKAEQKKSKTSSTKRAAPRAKRAPKASASKEQGKPTHIVGMGASAGGLEAKAHELGEATSALRILLKRMDEDREELEGKVLINVKELTLPYLEKLKSTPLSAHQKTFISILESNLFDIVSPFAHRLSSKYLNLTHTEINVANLVKEGKRTKEIAQLLGLSVRTVEVHRQSIRNKLGLKNRKANLRSHLMSLL